MPAIAVYILKLSISLAGAWLFYRIILQRLTFYNWNRIYLVGYSILSFAIPFININPVLQDNAWSNSSFVQFVPVLGPETSSTNITSSGDSGPGLAGLILGFITIGVFIMLLRLIIQYVSFRKMLKKATLVQDGPTRLYTIDEQIIPFSFGNAIFFNPSLHSDEELKEIILHEFVHVRQRHSIDIIWSECLCLLNWYNPFAWLLRKSIRQNLEFIADQQVLKQGIDRKQYQYLLLKVIGQQHFSIATQFNFSSLKKRIAMMNKMKSAGLHLVKFLFILPLVAVLLLAFRANNGGVNSFPVTSTVKDTVPEEMRFNDKGFSSNITKIDGNCTVVVTDRTGKEIARVLLDDWKKQTAKYEEQYGSLLPPPPSAPLVPSVQPVAVVEGIPLTRPLDVVAPLAPVQPLPVSTESPCNELIPVTVAGTTLAAGVNVDVPLHQLATEFEVTDKKAWIKLKDGSIENYDLTKISERKAFEKKYGHTEAAHVSSSTAVVATGYAINNASTPVAGYNTNDIRSSTITGGEDIVLTITQRTTQAQLDQMVADMKAKGVELSFDDVDFENGKLVNISGQMKSGTSRSNFSVNEFEKLVLAMVKKDGKIYLKVSTKDNQVVI